MPHRVLDSEELVWDEDAQPSENYRALGQRLTATGDLYRRPGYASGLLHVSGNSDMASVVIDDGRRLGALVVDRVPVRVVKAGNSKGTRLPASHLGTMLASETFLQQFRPVDDVLRVAHYLPDFSLLACGYNDGGPGQRLLYVGPEPQIESRLQLLGDDINVGMFALGTARLDVFGGQAEVWRQRAESVGHDQGQRSTDEVRLLLHRQGSFSL